jgi:endonuclease/exonuclease/phosphatase family metal-dependent hydrolase
MRLLSLNVALFETNNSALSDFLLQQKPDILCLQEVTKRLDDSTNEAYISKNAIDHASSNLSFSFFAPTMIIRDFSQKNFHQKENFFLDFGGSMEFGNYVKSKFEISKAINVFLQNQLTYVTDWSNWPDEDYRAVQVVDLVIGNEKLRILNYHGIWTKDKQGNQKALSACQKICNLAKEVDYPSIITGDFNLFPNTESISLFNKDFVNLVEKFEIKSTRPATNELSNLERNVVDYIFVSKEITVNSLAVIDNTISDHLPLILDFNI